MFLLSLTDDLVKPFELKFTDRYIQKNEYDRNNHKGKTWIEGVRELFDKPFKDLTFRFDAFAFPRRGHPLQQSDRRLFVRFHKRIVFLRIRKRLIDSSFGYVLSRRVLFLYDKLVYAGFRYGKRNLRVALFLGGLNRLHGLRLRILKNLQFDALTLFHIRIYVEHVSVILFGELDFDILCADILLGKQHADNIFDNPLTRFVA